MPQLPEGVPDYARGYENFPGKIARTQHESTPAWKRRATAPVGAPNIVVVLVDDLGFSDIEPYGGEVPTPTLSAMANDGVLMTNYHTTPVCSPARAALLTGLNPHRAGFGSVAEFDAGFPNLRLEIADDVATLPETLRASGYATFAVGKWHLTREALMHDAADKGSWPVQRGFDRYYGSMEGCNSFFHPNRMIADNTPTDPSVRPSDYYVTDDLTDQAIAMIKGSKASEPSKPLFMYFAHIAMHGPLGAKSADLERVRGKYDEGWDLVRERRFARQIDKKLFPNGAKLSPRHFEPGFEVEAWDSLPPDERERYARYMEVYAAMVGTLDESLTRLRDTLDELDELDNTIFLFTSDNGGTNEGGPTGTRSYFSRFVQMAGLPADWEVDVDRDLDLIGGPRTMIHYPRGWGQVSNTPFRYYKGQTHAGGVRVPLLISWARGLRDGLLTPGIRDQYQYVTDLFPTLLDLAGVDHLSERHGQPVKSIDGVSFGRVLASAEAPSARVEQYAEFGGNRGFYRDGWKIVTLHQAGHPLDDSEWELYDVRTDPTELVNLAAAEPEKLAELAEAWERAAWENSVFPIPALGPEGLPSLPDESEICGPVTLLPGTPQLERYRSSKLTGLRSFDILVTFEHQPDAEGILVAHGDQGGGYVVFVEDGCLHLAYNEYGRMHVATSNLLQPGPKELKISALARPDVVWDFLVTDEDATIASLPNVAMMVGMAPFSGIEVGANTAGPVYWELCERRGAFPYSGNLGSVAYLPGELANYDGRAVAEAELASALYYD